jgi:hypothetical protein
MKHILTAAAAAAAVTIATPAAASVTFNGTNGSNLSASAMFDVVGGHLQVTLTNTSGVDVNDPAQILHALFWDMTGNPSLSYTSANICGSCTFTGAEPTWVPSGATSPTRVASPRNTA